MVRSMLAMMLLASGDAARVAKRRNTGVKGCGVKGASASKRGVNISIVNGQPAEECAWNWQVGLRSRASGSPWCGGMLISEEWVLTAAHCLAGESRINVIAGEWNTRQTSRNEQSSWSSQIISHPNYNSRTMNSDLGLIKLETPVAITDCVGTVCLPDADVAPGSSCMITGWGTLRSGGSSPDTLQEAQVSIISNSDCTSKYNYSPGEIDDSMICAQGKLPDGSITDACQGDSGGPLVCENNGQWTIAGATSWGYGCAGATHPGIWANVHSELDWINSHVYTGPPTPAPPTPPPPPPGTWELTGAGCVMDGNCISSNNHPSNYGNSQECVVELFGDHTLTTQAFNTESRYDQLTVGGVQYSGSNGPADGTYTGAISWSSDYSVTNTGWKLCRSG